MPWLIGEIETNCCRRNGAVRWWQEVGEHLLWSRLAQRSVVSAH